MFAHHLVTSGKRLTWKILILFLLTVVLLRHFHSNSDSSIVDAMELDRSIASEIRAKRGPFDVEDPIQCKIKSYTLSFDI